MCVRVLRGGGGDTDVCLLEFKFIYTCRLVQVIFHASNLGMHAQFSTPLCQQCA